MIYLNPPPNHKVLQQREKLSNWRKCRHLIIDEISMIDADYFDCLDFVARSIRSGQRDLPMGGIQLILSGDFLQLPPVTNRGEAERKRFCFQADAWNDCVSQIIQLTKIKRQTDSVFIDLLEEIRFGKCTQRTVDLFAKRKHLVFKDKEILPTKLCTHKDDVEFINKRELESLGGEPRVFKVRNFKCVFINFSYVEAKRL